MSSHGFPHSGSNHKNNSNEPITPRRLELSLNPSDGSLLTAPLTQVLLSATDSLYSDLYNMAQGELDVTTAALQPDADTAQHEEENAVPMQQTKRERMSNLSFAQRRHELAWRLAQHGKSIQHVAGLTAAAASSDLSNSVAVSSTALQHARTAWVQADEAQDALYFFHAQLFPARAAPHDVYGALDVLLAGRWFDLPTRLRVTVDRYEASRENEYSRQQVDEQWQMAVRDKLLRGELGWMRKQQTHLKQPLWKVSLRGGIVKLTKGKPKTLGHHQSTTRSYPIEALLTVLSTSAHPEWTLLSVEVQVHAKTGEFNHQLETSNRQRYDLHRLCALAMRREEARARQQQADTEQASGTIARPLHALFQVAHVFSLSWQLEMLSAQAQALRRGVWAAGESNPITVTPVRFLNNNDDVLGVISVSFWRVDDAYGPPSMGDLSLDEQQQPQQQETESGRKNYAATTSQLTLSIRAESDAGIKISLSGAASIMSVVSTQPHIRSTIENLLEAASDPFALSMSDALLAATMLCAERKCHAVVSALQPVDRKSVLPEWILLELERGSIAVAARISYHGLGPKTKQSGIPILFRVMCDARTGSFVCTFPRSTQLLLGRLAGNVVQASESLALRIGSLPQNRRRAAAANSSVRVVRDAFDGLIRSMNLLGQRTGVGSAWDNVDGQSALLRERAIQAACADVRVSLMRCCGMAALYGLAPLSIGGAVGLDASPDQAGRAMESIDGYSFLAAPPISIMLDQQLIETTTTTSDGVSKKTSYLEQSIFAIACSVDANSLTLYPFDISLELDSPTAVPTRKNSILLAFKLEAESSHEANGSADGPPVKRMKHETNGNCPSVRAEDMMSEVSRFSAIVASCIDSLTDTEPSI